MLNTCGLILEACVRDQRFRCSKCKLSNDTENYYFVPYKESDVVCSKYFQVYSFFRRERS